MRAELTLDQNREGYRFSQDSFALAGFFDATGVTRVLDIGTGAGVVSALIGRKYQSVKITGLEIDPETAFQASSNFRSSGLENVTAVIGDLRLADRFFRRGKFCAVLCNPPYFKAGTGRLSPNKKRAVARHEISMTLVDLVEKSTFLLKPGGALLITMICQRRAEYVSLLQKQGFSETRYREVLTVKTGSAKIFLSEARLGVFPKSVIEPPLLLRSTDGDSAEYLHMLEELS